jgi:hypothetical protein
VYGLFCLVRAAIPLRRPKLPQDIPSAFRSFCEHPSSRRKITDRKLFAEPRRKRVPAGLLLPGPYFRLQQACKGWHFAPRLQSHLLFLVRRAGLCRRVGTGPPSGSLVLERVRTSRDDFLHPTCFLPSFSSLLLLLPITPDHNGRHHPRPNTDPSPAYPYALASPRKGRGAPTPTSSFDKELRLFSWLLQLVVVVEADLASRQGQG